MATFSKNIEFTFTVPPEALDVDPDDEDTFPKFKINTSGSDKSLQAVLLHILPCLTITSKEGGAEYVFQENA